LDVCPEAGRIPSYATGLGPPGPLDKTVLFSAVFIYSLFQAYFDDFIK